VIPKDEGCANAAEPRTPSVDEVLIADDDPVSRRMLENWLQKWKFRVTAVQNGLEAWAVLQQEDAPFMAILDWMMPGIDGIELCRRIRKQTMDSYRYVVLLTAKRGKADKVAGLEAGADDYLIKPFDVDELRARVRAGGRILQLQHQLIRAQEALKFEAAHDRLTGIWNRGAISDLLQRELRRSVRNRDPLGVMMVDVDHFKRINDSHGHLTGDEVLRQVAHRLVETVRTYDYVGRYGGEEFLVVISSCSPADLISTAERMRQRIAGEPITAGTAILGVAVSIGLASSVPGNSRCVQWEELVRSADAALYLAKANGRNRIEVTPLQHPVEQGG
jgi:two-component system, cell cycle response regulator